MQPPLLEGTLKRQIRPPCTFPQVLTFEIFQRYGLHQWQVVAQHTHLEASDTPIAHLLEVEPRPFSRVNQGRVGAPQPLGESKSCGAGCLQGWLLAELAACRAGCRPKYSRYVCV